MTLSTSMKLFTFTVILLLSVTSFAHDKPAEQQVLESVRHNVDLFQKESAPFQLDVDFVAQISVPTPGHLTLIWEAFDRSWSKVVMGPFEQIVIRNGEKSYTLRNYPYTPVRVAEVFRLLRFAQDFDGLTVTKEKQRTEGGVEIACLDAKDESQKGSPRHTICVNAASHEVMSDEWKLPPDEKRRQQYSEYADFLGLHYPRKLELLVNGSKAVTAQVTGIKQTTLDPAFLVAPKGAIERRMCANMKHAIPVKTPDPAYPKSASENRIIGDTIAVMTILTDGSVDDVHLAGKSASSMDEATLQTLKGWRFKPAMCGAEPVVSDIEVVVSFRIGR
jgi:TonB family protein